MSKFDENKWMEEVRGDLTLGREAFVRPPCIFSASAALLKEFKDAYVPQIVSIGPYHFGKTSLKGMETFKGDAARREVGRIQRARGDHEFSFGQVIDKIKSREEDIKLCYDKEISFKGEVLHWMMARDACFILEFFRNHLVVLEEDGDAAQYHPIFGSESENPGVKSEIMKDLIKLDNQIPLFILEEVLAMEMKDSPDAAKAKLDKLLRTVFDKMYYRPIEFCAKAGESRMQNHILDIYHYSCLGSAASENKKGNGNEVKLAVYCSCCAGSDCGQFWCAAHVLQQSGNSPNHICEQGASSGSAIGENAQDDKDSKQLEWRPKLPSAVELKNGGVRIQPNGKNVDDIRYEGKTLTLVPLKLDADSEVYIRNLIALEICSPDYKQKKMTAYTKFIYDLCQTVKGEEVMRDAGVIIGDLWNNSRFRRLLRVSHFTISQPKCQSIKETREKLSKCYKTQRSIVYRSLWNEFWKAYGSKPWLVVGGF